MSLARMARPRLLPLAVGLWVAAGAALAQAQPAPAGTTQLEQRLEQSLKLIDALSRRVEALEKQLQESRGTTAAAPAQARAPVAAASAAGTNGSTGGTTNASTAARVEELERTVSQLTSAQGRDTRDTGLPLHGFADVGWSQVRHPAPGQKSAFAVGSLDFYLTPELGKVRTLVELNVGVESEGETEIDLERAQLGYAFSDQLTLWLGRFHTPFGYWNMAFHHGAQIQPSVSRPRLLDFEDDGGILPVHTTGLWGTGSLRLPTGRLSYHLYTGNGTRLHDGALDPNPSGDDNGNRVVGFALQNRFSGALDGLTVGINGLRQSVSAYDATDALLARTRLAMVGAHAVYDNEGWELIAEGYRLRNTDLSGTTGSHDSSAGYLHLSRNIADRWTPYLRLERASLDQADNYFALNANGRSYTRQVLGLRYDTDPRAALKFEWNRTRDEGGLQLATDQWRFQYAVGF